MDYISNKIENIITRIISIYEKRLDIDNNQIPILRYSLRLVISTVLGYVLALIVAYILNIFLYVLVIMITISLFRAFSGGAHCSNMINCGIYGMIIVSGLGMLVKFTKPSQLTILVISILVFIFSIWAINKYAPADTPGKPIKAKAKRLRLKKTSFILGCLWYGSIIGWYFIFGKVNWIVYASTLGVFWQSFTLTKTGYKFCHICDMALNKVLFTKGDMYA